MPCSLMASIAACNVTSPLPENSKFQFSILKTGLPRSTSTGSSFAGFLLGQVHVATTTAPFELATRLNYCWRICHPRRGPRRYKTTPTSGEKVASNIYGQFFNASNRHRFTSIDGNFSDSGFGRSSGVSNPRRVQVGTRIKILTSNVSEKCQSVLCSSSCEEHSERRLSPLSIVPDDAPKLGEKMELD